MMKCKIMFPWKKFKINFLYCFWTKAAGKINLKSSIYKEFEKFERKKFKFKQNL